MQANAADAAVDVGDQPELFHLTAFQRYPGGKAVVQTVKSLAGIQHVSPEFVFVLLSLNIVVVFGGGFAEPGR